jgi:hypothetical protein
MKRIPLFVLALFVAMSLSPLDAQDPESAGHQHAHVAPSQTPAQQEQKKPPMDMPGMQHGHMAQTPAFIDEILQHTTPGTSAEPNSAAAPMIMKTAGKWAFMFHFTAFLNAEQQSGPRGSDKVFSTNWFMPMAQRRLGPGQLTLRTMLSFEPGTVTGRFYPELFQQGETAFGRPINDGQHPHDFFMEIAGLYDWKLGENALLSFYAAPVGDPAMGPPAFGHRISASENPLAPLGHHLQDSTHIADDVVTAGLAYKLVRLEASGFHGREPDEFRWNIDSGAIDSWSTRLTVQPGQNWSTQYSYAHLTSPEQLNPGEDVQRMTASVIYNRPLSGDDDWTSSLIWGRNHDVGSGENFNGYLLESTLRFAHDNFLWGRIENVDRTTDLLLGKQPEPPGFEERFLARLQAYTLGYDRDFHFIPLIATAFGGQVTFYGAPASLAPLYGEHPVGAILFVRFRPRSDLHTH